MTDFFELRRRNLVFNYLDEVRDSGLINMSGASRYIQEKFHLDQKTSDRLATEWREYSTQK